MNEADKRNFSESIAMYGQRLGKYGDMGNKKYKLLINKILKQ